MIYRCESCGRLLLREHIARGVCGGHRVKLALSGSLLEFIQVLFWKVTGRLKENA